jgi:hypothetical protein
MGTWSTGRGGLELIPWSRHLWPPLAVFYHRNGISPPLPPLNSSRFFTGGCGKIIPVRAALRSGEVKAGEFIRRRF